MEIRDDSYDLFRRAVVERDADAWAGIVVRYRRLMISWAARCQVNYAAWEHPEDLADRALARAWAALSPERFAGFPNTSALLAYLRTCVTATAIDVARAQTAQERAFRPLTRDAVPTPEWTTIAQLGRAELWQLINKLVVNEADRITLVERFVFDLPPRTIQARHPALFADVSAVYTSIRKLRTRLRHNKDLQQLYAEHLTL